MIMTQPDIEDKISELEQRIARLEAINNISRAPVGPDKFKAPRTRKGIPEYVIPVVDER